jgi:hypothetical protein
MVVAMSRDEGDLDPVYRPYCRRRRRLTVRGVHLDGAGIVEELVETGASEDADHSSLLLDAEPEEEEDPASFPVLAGFPSSLSLLFSLAGLTDDGLERESVE